MHQPGKNQKSNRVSRQRTDHCRETICGRFGKPIENQKCIEVSAGLIFRNGRLLITQRHIGAHLGGLWEFPGGKREADETFEQCLSRELREELGIEVNVGELLESLTHTYPEKTVVLKFFRCELKQHEPRALGCLDLKWITAAELRDYEFPAADARLLEKLECSPELWRSKS